MNGSLVVFAVRRLGASVVLLAVVLTLTFFLVRLAPGDPMLLLDDPRVSADQREALRTQWGLDRPILEQYIGWIRSIVVEGDLGVSIVHRRPITTLLIERVPATLLLTGSGLVLQYWIGLLLGVTAARRAGSRVDLIVSSASLVLYALPVFWTGLMALSLFSFRLGWLPGGGIRSVDSSQWDFAARSVDLFLHLLLPSLVLSIAATGATVRFTRDSLLEALQQDYVRTARAKGLSERRVIWLHALRNAATPLIQLLGLSLPFLLSGALIVEVVFSWPGLGRLAHQSVLNRDYPLIVAATALSGLLVILGNLAADLCQAAIDPRVRE